jgi:tyrosinase
VSPLAKQWSKDNGGKVVALEQPIQGANGDMGENDTAALDPIFFFHHCFVDRVFWLWQQRHRATDTFDVIPAYAGTNSMDGGGHLARHGLAAGPLHHRGGRRAATSRDVVNIESQLGYTRPAFARPWSATPGKRRRPKGQA